jgi:hypothetical protein
MWCVGDNLGWFTERVNWTPEDFRIQENQVQIPFSEVKYAVTFHWTSDTTSKWKKNTNNANVSIPNMFWYCKILVSFITRQEKHANKRILRHPRLCEKCCSVQNVFCSSFEQRSLVLPQITVHPCCLQGPTHYEWGNESVIFRFGFHRMWLPTTQHVTLCIRFYYLHKV